MKEKNVIHNTFVIERQLVTVSRVFAAFTTRDVKDERGEKGEKD